MTIRAAWEMLLPQFNNWYSFYKLLFQLCSLIITYRDIFSEKTNKKLAIKNIIA